jgi:hypothetical protein
MPGGAVFLLFTESRLTLERSPTHLRLQWVPGGSLALGGSQSAMAVKIYISYIAEVKNVGAAPPLPHTPVRS